MNCFDCSRVGVTEVAMANCVNCGAGLCSEHATEIEITITKTVMIGLEKPLPLKARRILCETCDAALAQKRY